MTLSSQMQLDTGTVIAEFPTSISIKSKGITTNDEGKETTSWTEGSSFNAVWQDNDGGYFIGDNGEQIQYEAAAYIPYNTTISIGNKVEKDNVDYYVIAINQNVEHKKIYLSRYKEML